MASDACLLSPLYMVVRVKGVESNTKVSCLSRLYEEAISISNIRSILISYDHIFLLLQSFYELWGEGGTFEAMASDIKLRSAHLMHQYSQSSMSWKIVVDCWGGRLSQEAQVQIIEKLAFLAFKVQPPCLLGLQECKWSRLLWCLNYICKGLKALLECE